VETTSAVSSSVYPLTAIVTNYQALVVTEGSLTRWTEDGQSSLFGSVENLTSNRISYSGLPALHDLSSGSYECVFSLELNPLPTCMSPVDAPDPVTRHSYLLRTLQVFVDMSGLTFVHNILLLKTPSSERLC